jgi:hypothetical protein
MGQGFWLVDGPKNLIGKSHEISTTFSTGTLLML